jgi:hypothetical protein
MPGDGLTSDLIIMGNSFEGYVNVGINSGTNSGPLGEGTGNVASWNNWTVVGNQFASSESSLPAIALNQGIGNKSIIC